MNTTLKEYFKIQSERHNTWSKDNRHLMGINPYDEALNISEQLNITKAVITSNTINELIINLKQFNYISIGNVLYTTNEIVEIVQKENLMKIPSEYGLRLLACNLRLTGIFYEWENK